MKVIIDYLDLNGCIDDESVSYNVPGPYPFTLEEFHEFTDKVWNDAGGWDASDKYQVEGAYFETYYIPFEYEGKQYVLNVMYGQGAAWTLYTKAAHDEYKVYSEELDAKFRDEEE
jgi:hypothetical protein